MLFTVDAGAAAMACSCSFGKWSQWLLALIHCVSCKWKPHRACICCLHAAAKPCARCNSLHSVFIVVCTRQAPEGAEHEKYKKGQHLKGVDAANAERVRAEMVSAAYCLYMSICGV